MKKLFTIVTLCLSILTSFAQNIGIGTNTPNPSALLDINSTTKGLLLPRMTTAQRFAITTPPNGLLVYDTERNCLYQYNGTGWTPILNGDYWTRAITSRDRIGNNTDSIGIGTFAPTQRLDVNGNIRSRDDVLADGRIIATGTVTGSGLITSGALTVSSNGIIGGNFTAAGDLSTNSDLIINNSGATLQLKNGSNVNKGFFQIAGDDVRLGTNSGNNLGNVIVRMDGNNRFTFTDEGRFTLSADNTPTIHFNSGGSPKALLQVQGEDLTINAPGNKVRISNVVYVDDATNRVGIGTISPTERLHVSGNALFRGNTLFDGEVEANGDGEFNDDLWVTDTIGCKTVFAGKVRATNMAVGYNASAAGFGSFVVGENAHAYADGICILADSAPGDISTNNDNTMLARFVSGYRFYTNASSTTGVLMNNGSNSWSSISDSTKKENFIYADGSSFLKKIAGMRLGSWNYKTQDKQDFRHYGPMAQEFYANFGNDGIGKIGNDTTIATADIDGVMMIAIQSLIKEKEALKLLYENQQAEIISSREAQKKLMERLEKMEAILSKMPATK